VEGGRFAAAVRYTFSGASEINLGEKRIDRTNCPLDPGVPAGGDSRPLQRFMRLGTVAKKLFAAESAASGSSSGRFENPFELVRARVRLRVRNNRTTASEAI